ncbi:helix-turn-helix transcriptional regulator [Streptomyces actinomycinicus]|uniref:Helix-turn-helix transcriptional regulator n=1 Tax=Streptomyces actinomycinicus TaxID=1695166 RepID=A0A937EHT4_9ACTN|nr:helix-turn-helix domain-containing protein [Streptomyces actinomycinicus]MBL1082289.1 helix-turn-helix transcriptional regulator [Streptomyces actinomycinicus]
MSHSHTDVSDQVSNEACPLTEVLDHVAGKWSIGILVAAAHGPIRFTELERTITGISRRMLTLNLRKLERDGLLVRTVHPTVPPKVEYSLTPMARELHASLTGLVGWAERHRADITAARAAYDAATASAGANTPSAQV